ncbi:MAG TPA: prohibitin family protein [candidate division WOR-3 bacterium]|uniref:Prohibitin family protein n=1 Tax=candidate division WOR-3 bacterium TaxID=2052148 RepID=A0A7C0XD72_UNCW3|nr:prohibitin family protein [candidate division WOR-3 bacterium]
MFAFFIVLVLLGIAVYYVLKKTSRVVITEKNGEVVTVRKVGLSSGLILAILGVLILLLIFFSIRIVPVGHAMVKFNVLTKRFSLSREGVTFVPPVIYKTYIYDLRRQEYTMSSRKGEGKKKNIDDSLWSPTKEGLQVGIDLTCWYRIKPDSVISLHRRIGPDYDEKVVRPAIRSIVRHVISEYPIMDVYSEKRRMIQGEILRRVRELLEKDGFIIEEIVLRDVHFTPDFSKAIEEKQIAQQEAERMKYVLEKERKEAERKKIEAEGTARAIEIVSRQLKRNPEYIKYLYVDKLSDKVQVIVSDQSTIMNLGDILKKGK